MAMRGPVSPKAVVIGLVCLAFLFQGKVRVLTCPFTPFGPEDRLNVKVFLCVGLFT